ncbi:efflux transporter outer membrane subunit [Sphingobium sp. YC-XJ3]|jgi:multidrug efflux system outer membrane protein|uniref:efflux transporter outer membrane subunit n=1 Tax=Sphingobium sp. YC-XJ3 TaxID=3024245 RepID=UPI00235F096C|nr:efflux transporter outer membrane subunit [Sphingobium sp. YC-XJ3]WDA35204.1 efflux transporter outer membrane subunit [Sphingobium sp. YC-XJ3]WDA37260.1 efflux transporter outer membrane subunit [Sphingobium sp. YC-XJ3]WDA38827.1 efflux transporter outer membrane subunit [Sphingobium sp. YC-XJ3]
MRHIDLGAARENMVTTGMTGATRRGRAGLTACLAGSILLAGCSFAPPHVRPAQPVPSSYSGETAAGPSVARIGWHDFFREDHLRALIMAALENNRDVRIATARVAEARAAWRIEGAALYPELNGVGTGTRGRSIINLPGLGTQSYDIKQITAQLSASWELDFWGRLRNLRDAARNQYLATEEARRAVATDLIAQVANGYLLERDYEERVAIARRTIATREESLRIMRRRYEVGSGSKLEMTQAQMLLAQAQSTLQGLDQDREINRNALALLVGGPVEIPPGPLGLAEAAPQVDLPPGLPSELLSYRPDVVAAEYRLRAADANIGAARAAFFPNITLTGAFGTASADLDGLFGDGSRSWSFTPTITQPLFNAGRLAANLDVAKARQVEAVADYEKTIQSAFRDVSDALVRRRQLALQIETTRTVLEALRERARLAQLRFDNGRSAYLEVLDAQRDLFDTEQALVQLRRAHLAAAIALYAALGGGFVGQPAFDTGASAIPASGEQQR